ncbi:hypothetical protein V8E54_009500 [Elaphomyces granulatus]
MAKGKKSSTLGRNEFLFSGRKHQVAIPETNLCMLRNDHHDQKRIKIQACWNSFRIFHSYNAIIDPMIDCLALVSKPIAIKAAKYQVADIIPLAGWKNGVVIFTELRIDGQEQEDVPMLIADLGVECDIVLGRRWLEESHMQLDCNGVDLEPSSSVPISCDQVEQVPLRDQGPIDQKDYENMAALVTTFAPEVHEEDLSVRLEEMDQLLDELNEEDACQSRIPIIDDQCPQPLVRLPIRDDVRLYRLDDSCVARIPEPPVATSRENEIVTDEDLRPLVRLLDHRQHDGREGSFNGNTLSFDIEVGHHQCRGSNEGDRKEVSLSLSTPLSPAPDTEEIGIEWSHSCLLAADPILEALLVEAAWSEILGNCEDNVVPVYSKENEPNDAMRQVVPQIMDGYPDQDFDSDSNSVISSTLDVYEAVATMSYREGLPKSTWVVMNYDDWRDNDVSDDQNLVIQQVALQTPEGYPG